MIGILSIVAAVVVLLLLAFRDTPAVGWLVWAVLRAYVFVFRRPSAQIARGTITRWFLTSTPAGDETGPPGWYLHRINAPDYTTEEHNHPWAYAKTWILRGGYCELRSAAPYWRNAGSTAELRPDDFHVNVIVRPNTWTLFYAGPKSGLGWGFRAYVGGPVRKASKRLRVRIEDADADQDVPTKRSSGNPPEAA